MNKAHPLSNFEIDNYLKKTPYYRGCYMSNTLPKKILPNEITVVNLDSQQNPGTHWCLIYNSDRFNYAIYIDTFGLIPNIATTQYLYTSGKKVLYSTTQIQHIKSVLCGYYCIYFAKELSKGANLYDLLYSFSFDHTVNEQIISKYFNLS